VKDQGAGISGPDIAKLFSPFSRLDNMETRAVPGVGLGLYVSKKIIELHGGRIVAESQPGRGTTMRVIVPVTRGASAAVA
jgi:signal transduction histidine kinase